MLNKTFSVIFKHRGHPHQNVTKMIVQKTAILHTLGQKSAFYPKIHTFKIHIFHKKHIFKIAFFHKKSHYFKYQIQVTLWIKSVILPQCVTLSFWKLRFGTVCMPYFRIARDPTAAALADPYLGQSIGPVPGYGVSLPLQLSIFFF